MRLTIRKIAISLIRFATARALSNSAVNFDNNRACIPSRLRLLDTRSPISQTKMLFIARLALALSLVFIVDSIQVNKDVYEESFIRVV